MIYRFYSWRLNAKDDTPGTTTEILMLLPHLAQVAIIYLYILYFNSTANFISYLNTGVIIGFVFVGQVLYHLLIYNKKRWLSYIDEFKNETPKQRLRGTYWIAFYTLLTYAIFFLSEMFQFFKD